MRLRIALSLSLLLAAPALCSYESSTFIEHGSLEQRLEKLGSDLYQLLVQLAPHVLHELHQLPQPVQAALDPSIDQELTITLESLVQAAQITLTIINAAAHVEHNETLSVLCEQATQLLEDIDVLLGGNTPDDVTRGGILKVVPALLANVVRVDNRFLCTGTAELNPSAGTVALRVNGESKFNGDVSISGRLLVGDSNILTTQVINDNIIINGNLDVSGNTTLDNLTVNGTATFNDVSTFNADATFGDNINMQNTNSTGTVGVITKGGNRFMHNAGSRNTFLGENAGNFTVTGIANTGVGREALNLVSSGCCNTALGERALAAVNTGQRNTAIGLETSFSVSSQNDNTTLGFNAGRSLIGDRNTVIGSIAATVGTAGSDNIVIGYNSANAFVTDNNIIIGNPGVFADSNTIRLGNGSHTSLVLMATGAGATGLPGSGVATQNLQIDPATGAVTRFTSSARYKEDIRGMTADEIALLDQLNPATYYAKGTTTPRCYGLIAEEVAEVAKDLVIFNADNQPEAVRYEAIIPMLLGAYKTLSGTVDRLNDELHELKNRLESIK